MKGLIGFIAVIFFTSLTVGLIYYHCNMTEKENPTEISDSTTTLEPDTINYGTIKQQT